MTRRILALVLLVALATVPLGAGVVAAQSDGGTVTATPGENTTTVAAQVDESVYVESYHYEADNETFWLTLINDGDSSTTVTVTEAISREDAGERRFGISVVDVGAGETVETSLSAKRVDGAAAVMVLTPAAIESGSGVFLQESNEQDNRLIKGGASGGDVRAGAFAGGGVSLSVCLLGAWQYVASKNNEAKDAELEPKTDLLGRFRE